MLNFDIQNHRPLREMVYEELKMQILTGTIIPGTRMMEVELAEEMGVSRTPIREAIRKLELEGLVLMIPRKGAIVAEITVQDLEDVLEVRMALEELAVKIACKRITQEQLEEIKRRSAEFCKTLYGDDVAACAQADMTFHDAIYEATGNRRLVQILNNLREQMYRYRMEYLKDRQSHSLLVKEHEEIVQGLTERDADRALRVTNSHIERQRDYIIQQLQHK